MRKLICVLLMLLMGITPFSVSATETADIYPYDMAMSEFWFQETSAEYISESDAKALLLMEYSTGEILFSENEKEHLAIASVTKVMSTLLVMEALDSGRIKLDDSVTVSENAASMGGSQVFLQEGEQMSVQDLLKSLVVASANDATVALAEHICGSEAAFVAAMNKRAKELGCENSNFMNTNGLPIENHYSCALDVAIITRELMKHQAIFEYTKIWMDTIRNGTFGLANTNKLIRFYKGATGMKTGFTTEAMFCLSGTAERDGMHLIAVVLGASTSNIRFQTAKSLLDFGFANYAVTVPEKPKLESLKVKRGVEDNVKLEIEDISVLLPKGGGNALESKAFIKEDVQAPVEKNLDVGYVAYYLNGKEVARAKVVTSKAVSQITYGSILSELFGKLIFNK